MVQLGLNGRYCDTGWRDAYNYWRIIATFLIRIWTPPVLKAYYYIRIEVRLHQENFVDYLCVKYNKFKNTSGVGNWMPYPPFCMVPNYRRFRVQGVPTFFLNQLAGTVPGYVGTAY